MRSVSRRRLCQIQRRWRRELQGWKGHGTSAVSATPIIDVATGGFGRPEAPVKESESSYCWLEDGSWLEASVGERFIQVASDHYQICNNLIHLPYFSHHLYWCHLEKGHANDSIAIEQDTSEYWVGTHARSLERR